MMEEIFGTLVLEFHLHLHKHILNALYGLGLDCQLAIGSSLCGSILGLFVIRLFDNKNAQLLCIRHGSDRIPGLQLNVSTPL